MRHRALTSHLWPIQLTLCFASVLRVHGASGWDCHGDESSASYCSAVSLLQRGARAARPLVQLGTASKVDGPPAGQRNAEQDPFAALLSNRMPDVTVDAPGPLQKVLAEGRPRYLLSANTGHAGSTSLSKRASYAGDLQDILFRFENIGYEMNDHYVDEWLQWWDHRPDDAQQLKKVRDEYKVRVDQQLQRYNRSTYVDLGHHTLHGICHQIPRVFGPHAIMFRLRRDRYHTAYSFTQYQRDLCQNMFRICPLHNEVFLRPPGRDWTSWLWTHLNYSQQAFWYVDEVEAEWQLLVQAYPDLPRFECDWSDELDSCFAAVALVLRIDVANEGKGIKAKIHTSGGFGKMRKDLMRLDEEYKAFMNYSERHLSLLARVL